MKKILLLLLIPISLFWVYNIPTVNMFVEMITLNAIETTELTVDKNTLTMSWIINTQTPNQFKNTFKAHPNIDTLIMKNVPWSMDDEANLEISSWIAEKKLTIILEKDSEIASGGTDFFLAGNKRIIHDWAKIGVHSRSTIDTQASDLPKDDETHTPYIEYYEKLGFTKKQSEDFYFYTIQAAPADDIHWMTNNEIKKYNVATQIIQ